MVERPLRVLFATYPMAFHTPGGGEIQLLAYQRHLGAFGIDVTLFDPWNPRFGDFDLVHFFSSVGGSWHFCNFVKSLGLPLLISSSLWITAATRDTYPFEEIRAQLALSDCVVTNSTAESVALSAVLGLPPQRFSAIMNGVEPTFLEPADPQAFRVHAKIDGPFVLSVANIEPRKNQLRLAEAMLKMPDRDLVLVGSCRDPVYLDQVRATAGQKLKVINHIAHDDPRLRSAYAACDILALPSAQETPGLAALEAAAQGRPVVLTQEGSTREYFGDTVDYVDPLSANSIADGIRAASRRGPEDAATLRALVAERYLWPQTVAKLADLYGSMV